ncbi:MAG TPA: protein translocase subunit SecD [Pirellulales bacterium]|nr:protein translocase subunit SecD [Pirellulales bacterium]
MFGRQHSKRLTIGAWTLTGMIAVVAAVAIPTLISPSVALAQQAQAPAANPAAAVDTTYSGLTNLGIAIALIVGSFALGHWISRSVRLPDHSTRFGLVIFSVAASTVITVMGWPPRLGIDLRGGVILIYDIDQGQLHEGQQHVDALTLDKLVAAVTKRVNPGGIREVTVRPYGVNQIEIIIPEPRDAVREGEGTQSSEELDRIKKVISTSGALEFRIVADRRNPNDASVIDKATAPDADPNKNDVVEAGADGKPEVVAKWVPLDRTENAAQYTRDANYATRLDKRGQVQVLVMMDPYNVTGEYLRNASSGFDQAGKPAVKFSFDSRGSTLFGELTTANLPQGDFHRQLAIILDGRLVTAPRINSAIFDSGEITGSFTQEETNVLAAVLTAGQLPAALRHEPTSSMVIGPTLGADTIAKGVRSMLIATGVVVVFMLVYYRFAGFVANFAVILNVILTVAVMVLVKAAFTLSGLAGLALTVGMAVDANVLIYERMREELARGATLRMAIRNGFERATTTIIDANVTTLISAIVLYVIGTDQVKGFAVTLTLGILLNLFTAIIVSRAIFDIAEKQRWITKLRMMQILSGTNYDFIGKRRVAIALSLIVIGIGMVGVWARGKGLLDIDFTGGVSVETLFDRSHPQDIAVVRTKLEEHAADLPDLTVQDVHITEEPPGVRFLVITSESDENKVESELQQIFKGELAYNHLKVADVAAIGTETKPGAEPSTKPEGAAKPETKEGAALQTIGENELALAFQDDPAGKAPSDASKDASDTKPPADEKPEAAKPEDEKPETPAADAEKPAPKDPFVGGTSAKLTLDQPLSYDTLEQMFEKAKAADKLDAAVGLSNAEYEPGMERAFRQWDIKFAGSKQDLDRLTKNVEEQLAGAPYFPSSNKIGAAVARNTQEQAIIALLASIILIMVYVWFRFTQVMFGLSVIVALVHDVLVTLGALAVSYWLAPYLGAVGVEPFKINLPIIAAFLTIIGYSLNDTIVIFDRIREIRGKSPDITAELVNRSVNETLSRTLLTSLTVFLVVVILYAFGGQGIHGFAFALVVGTISGTYSTIYIATPVLIWLNKSQRRNVAASSNSRSTAAAGSR